MSVDLKPNHLLLAKTDFLAIARQYGIRIFRSCPYRKVWRLETEDGPKYLKQTRLYPSELRFIHEALQHLNRKGFHPLPQFRLSGQGEPFVTIHQDRFLLTDWYEGRELDFSILMDVKQATVFLAKFHSHSQGFIPPEQNMRSKWRDWSELLALRLTDLEKYLRMAWAQKETSVFSRLFLRYFGPFFRHAEHSFNRLSVSAYPEIVKDAMLANGFCHHDYSGRNILRTGDGQMILVDFDYCLRDLRIHDLINLLVRNLKHQRWQMWISRFILSQYHRCSPLAFEELQLMYILLIWPQEFWQIGRQYYEEKLPWPDERFVKRLERQIEQRFARERYLNEFPEYNGVYKWRENEKLDS